MLASNSMLFATSGRTYSLGKLATFTSKEAENAFWKNLKMTIGENSQIVDINHEVMEIVHSEVSNNEEELKAKKTFSRMALKATKTVNHPEEVFEKNTYVIDLKEALTVKNGVVRESSATVGARPEITTKTMFEEKISILIRHLIDLNS